MQTSYKVSFPVAKKKKPFSDMEIVEEHLLNCGGYISRYPLPDAKDCTRKHILLIDAKWKWCVAFIDEYWNVFGDLPELC